MLFEQVVSDTDLGRGVNRDRQDYGAYIIVEESTNK